MSEKPIGFRLGEVARLFKNKVREFTQEKGICCTYFQIVEYLKSHDNTKVTQKDICASIKMKAPTVSLTLQNMEDEGLIIRKKDEKDSRKTFVELSQQGLEFSDSIKSFFIETDKIMENALTKEELQDFYKCLDKIKEALERK